MDIYLTLVFQALIVALISQEEFKMMCMHVRMHLLTKFLDKCKKRKLT